MALQLMKIVVNVDGEISTSPSNTKFYYVTTAETAAGATLTIDAADFFDDTGEVVATLPELSTDNSYYSVYINGSPQMLGITAYTPGASGVGSLAITLPADSDPILVGTPVVLEIVNFTPNMSTTVNT